jgi:hypothetical protein
MGLEALKIIKNRSLTPPIVCESERGPALKQEQVFESNEVRVSLLVNVDNDTARPWATIPTRIFARQADKSEVPRETAPTACHYESTAVRASEAHAFSFVDKDLAPRAIGSRVRARTSTRHQGPRRSASFFQLPLSRARAVDQIVAAVPKFEAIEGSASRFGPNPTLPKAKEELIVAVACQESTRAQGITLKAERTETKSARCRGAQRHTRSSVSRA